LSEEPPSFVKNNPWTKILSERGKDDGKPVLTDQNPSDRSMTSKNHAQIVQSRSVTGPLKSQRHIKKRRLLVLRLAALGLGAEEIQQALAGEGVVVTTRCIYKDLVAVHKELDALDKHSLKYTVGWSFAELTELWREGWLSYHKPDLEAGFLKLGALRELRNLHRSKTRLAGLEAEPGMQLTAMMTPTWMGVQITMSGQPGNIDDIVRDGGIEYAAIHQGNPRSND
jgi:hypothetical protein